MQVLSVLILVIATNLDNLAIGLAYGIRKIRIPFKSNFIIAILSGLAMALFSYSGHLLSKVIPIGIANVFGGLIVAITGVWALVSYYREKKNSTLLPSPENELSMENLKIIVNEPEKADIDYSGDISVKEAVLLGAALAINCLATGLGAGMTGMNTLGITILVILSSLLSVWVGIYLGKRYASSFFGDSANMVAGVFLIVVGIYEMFF